MRIGLITLHRAENYGSVLQALALQDVLQKLGHEVTVLDYCPDRCTSWGRLKRLKEKNPRFKNPLLLFAATLLMIPSYIRRAKRFEVFVKKYLKVSDMFSTNDEAKQMNWDMDAYCTGSDQVWNSHWNEGIDKALYLDFAPKEANVFSYASSFGVSKLDKNEVGEIKRLLSKYRFLSVREDTGVEILRDLGRVDGVLSLDPTLLMNKEMWMKYVGKNRGLGEYILTYNLHHDSKVDDYAMRLKEKYGLPIINISYNMHDVIRKGKLCWCPYVEDFLSMFLHAKYVVSDSFHATVFSILFEKKFVTITPEIASSRISSLLKIVDLEYRNVSAVNEILEIDQETDYSTIRAKLEEEREKSLDYLRNSLKQKMK